VCVPWPNLTLDMVSWTEQKSTNPWICVPYTPTKPNPGYGHQTGQKLITLGLNEYLAMDWWSLFYLTGHIQGKVGVGHMAYKSMGWWTSNLSD